MNADECEVLECQKNSNTKCDLFDKVINSEPIVGFPSTPLIFYPDACFHRKFILKIQEGKK
jgi:hypothetical protein